MAKSSTSSHPPSLRHATDKLSCLAPLRASQRGTRRGLQGLGGAGLLALSLSLAYASGPYPDMLSTADRDRLSRYTPLRQATLDYVRAHADPQDLVLLEGVLDGSGADIAPAQLAGVWYCRTFKLSRNTKMPLVIYGNFACLVTDDNDGLRLQKLTGSQRTSGAFYDIGETRLAYVGAMALGDEGETLDYGVRQDRNQVGYLYAITPNRLRLELPAPPFESDFDILSLYR